MISFSSHKVLISSLACKGECKALGGVSHAVSPSFLLFTGYCRFPTFEWHPFFFCSLPINLFWNEPQSWKNGDYKTLKTACLHACHFHSQNLPSVAQALKILNSQTEFSALFLFSLFLTPELFGPSLWSSCFWKTSKKKHIWFFCSSSLQKQND